MADNIRVVPSSGLLPCPFCGSNDIKIVDVKSEDDGRVFAKAECCRDCHAQGRIHYPIGWTESEQAAKEAWNDRVPIVAPSSEPSIPAQPTVAVNVPEDEVGECEMCGGSGEIRAIDHGDIPCPTCVSREKREQLGRAEDRIAELGETVARRESMLDRLSESNDNQLRRIAELEGALTRLRDCDWIISLPDRMDAVRDIARAALAAPSGVKP